jgi:hypothetical protein
MIGKSEPQPACNGGGSTTFTPKQQANAFGRWP